MDLATLALRVDSRQVVSAGRDLDRLDSSARRVETGTSRMTAGFARVGAGFANARGQILGVRGALAGLAGAAGIASFARTADTATQLTAQLRLVSKSMEEVAGLQQKLFATAQGTRSGFEETVSLYARLARSTQALGFEQNRLLNVTEAVGQAVAISGSPASAAAAALFQLGQGLASGALRGEELNSVLEQTPRLAQAIAEGMGLTIGQLRAFGAEGKITSQTIIRAIEDQSAVLASEFALMPRTVAQAMTQLRNQWLLTVGDANEASGATLEFTKAIDRLREAIASPEFIGGLTSAADGMALMARHMDRVAVAGGVIVGLKIGASFRSWQAALVGGLVGGLVAYLAVADDAAESTAKFATVIDPTEAAIRRLSAQIPGLSTGIAGITIQSEAATDAVSRLGSTIAGLGAVQRSSYSLFSDAPESVQKSVAALREQELQFGRTAREQAVFTALKNAGIDAESEYAARVRASAEATYDAEQRAEGGKGALRAVEETRNMEMTNRALSARARGEEDIARMLETRARIERETAGLPLAAAAALGEQIAREEQLNRAVERQQELRQQINQVAQVFEANFTRAFDSAIEGTFELRESVGALLKDLGRMLASQAFQMLLTGGSGGGGGLFGALFSGGGGATAIGTASVQRFAAGGVVDRATAFPMRRGIGVMGEAGPEAIMPLRRGPDGKLGVAAAGGGRAAQISVVVNLDARGADAAAVPAINGRIDRLERDLPGRVAKVLHEVNYRRMPLG